MCFGATLFVLIILQGLVQDPVGDDTVVSKCPLASNFILLEDREESEIDGVQHKDGNLGKHTLTLKNHEKITKMITNVLSPDWLLEST